MKKRNILLLVIMFYFLVCWKLPFYMLLMSVDLLEDAIVIKRQVSYTDVYYPHILAENRFIMGENVLIDWHIMDREMVLCFLKYGCSNANLTKSNGYFCDYSDFCRDAHIAEA